jgi:phosphatidylglycerophosphate synthase
VVPVRRGLAISLVALVALLVALTWTTGIGGSGWVVGLACGFATSVAVDRGVGGARTRALGPADLVTLCRATLSCGVAALVADSLIHEQHPLPSLVTLAAMALALDAVDGAVARRTSTTSTFGARFDGEADAFLILVLSVYVADLLAGWVLAIGTARYLFAAAGWVLPWMRGQLPPRYWRKVVAAIQGIVLTIAVAGVAPTSSTYAALVVAAALLAESFGRDVLWLWRHRSAGPAGLSGPAPRLHVRLP